MDEKQKGKIRIEASFRKGYQQGYDQAVKAFQDILKNGKTPESGITILINFVDNDLSAWRNGDYTRELQPPTLK